MPDMRARGVGDAAGMQVAVEAGLVDGVDWTKAHRDGREFPEIRHQAWVRVARQAVLADLLPEPVELGLAQPAFEKGAGIDPRRRVPLEKDLIAGRRVAGGVDPVLSLEEVVEAHLVQAGRRGVGGDVAADAKLR